MAATTILNAYDLSGGATESSVVSDPNNVNIGWKLSGYEGSGVIRLKWYVQVGGEDYHQLKDNTRKPIRKTLISNESGSLPVSGINATNLKIVVEVDDTVTAGTLSLYSL